MSKSPYKKGSLLAALDVGSSKIACFIARIADDEGHLELLGVGHHISSGVKSGRITSMAEAEAVIRKTVHASENMAAETMKGYPLREIIVNLPAIFTKTISCQTDVRISGHEITDNDIRRALAEAQSDVLDEADEDFELIHTIPHSYKIDGHGGIAEPRGMVANNMSVDVGVTGGDVSAMRNLAGCIERCHLDITAFAAGPYASGLATLVEDEMDLGCTVIDMGAGTTSYAVFHNHKMIACGAIPIGGQHVTNDIAQGLGTAINDAERIKCLYGSAMAGTMDEMEMIDVPRLGEDHYGEPNHVQRSYLVGIIQPRLEEIFEFIRSDLKDSGLGSLIGRRVVLTGGASQMPGMRDLAEYVLDKKARHGRPIRISSLPDAVSGPAFASVAGLLSYVSERSDEMPADILAQVQPESLFEKVRQWLKENW